MTLDTQYGHDSTPVAFPSLLSAKGVGAILGISVKTVHKLVREKKLACAQVTAATCEVSEFSARKIASRQDAVRSNPVRGRWSDE
jgi:hypothetical protein